MFEYNTKIWWKFSLNNNNAVNVPVSEFTCFSEGI